MYFLDPINNGHERPRTAGPQIRQQDGTLVWYGGANDDHGESPTSESAIYRRNAKDTHVCDWRGVTGKHLCWSERLDGGAGNRRKVIVNEHYETVQRIVPVVESANGFEEGNVHDFRMVDGGSRVLVPENPYVTIAELWPLIHPLVKPMLGLSSCRLCHSGANQSMKDA